MILSNDPEKIAKVRDVTDSRNREPVSTNCDQFLSPMQSANSRCASWASSVSLFAESGLAPYAANLHVRPGGLPESASLSLRSVHGSTLPMVEIVVTTRQV
jgi:hypothetical protein